MQNRMFQELSTTNETVVSYNMIFSHNSADYGGAIAIEEGTNLGVCDSIPHLIEVQTSNSSLIQECTHYTECFLRILINNQQSDFKNATASINFTQNYTCFAGSVLFGGLLDKCIDSSYTDPSIDIPAGKIL